MILILNQFPENDPAPTSRYLKEWAADFPLQGESIQWISGTPSYRLPPRSFFLRLLRELSTIFQIFWKALWAHQPSLIIASSSPPGLLILAVFMKFWHHAPLIHWAMDLHPDLSEALGEKPPLRRLLKFLMTISYPLSDAVFTLSEEMRRHLRLTYKIDSIITPLWPLYPIDSLPTVQLQYPPRWIYSGNLGKAHEWRTLLEAQRKLEEIASPFVLQLQGNAFLRLPTTIERPQQLKLHDYASEENLLSTLLSCHLLIATQNPSTTGLLWPCKLALLSVLPRPLLWIGDKKSSTSKQLQKRPHTAIFEPGENQQIAEWIQRYLILPPESDFQTWIDQQATKTTFLEQVRKVTLPLLSSKA